MAGAGGHTAVTVEAFNAAPTAQTVEIRGLTESYLYDERPKQRAQVLPAEVEPRALLAPGEARAWTFTLADSMIDVHRLGTTDELWIETRVGTRHESFRARPQPGALRSRRAR